MTIPASVRRVALKTRAPSINPRYNEQTSSFELSTTKVDENTLSDGHVIIKLVYIGNEPMQASWISGVYEPREGLQAQCLPGESVPGLGLGEVMASRCAKYQVGDHVTGMFPWQEYFILPEQAIYSKVEPSYGLPPPVYLGVLGLNGLTAYFALVEAAKLQKGQTVLISAAAGATGSLAVQIAKHVLGAKSVIGIVGSEEKGKWVRSLGADYTVNYRDKNYQKQLKDHIGTEYVDVFLDNVGGDMLSFGLSLVKVHGTVVACGAISGYLDWEKTAVKGWFDIISNRLTVHGFVLSDCIDRAPEAVGALMGAISEGKIDISDFNAVVDLSTEKNPFERVPETWYKLFTSEKPKGKLLTKVA